MNKPYAEAPQHRLLYANSHRVFRVISALPGILRVYGEENIPDEGGALVLANHRSWRDVFALPSSVHRHVTMVARHEKIESGLQGRYLRALGAIPVHRQGAEPGEIRAIIRRARDGHIVAMFPEETRDKNRRKSPEHADMKEFRPGAAEIARLAGVVTVPAALYNMDRFGSLDRAVIFGEPLDPPEKDGGDLWLTAVRARIEELYDEAHRERRF